MYIFCFDYDISIGDVVPADATGGEDGTATALVVLTELAIVELAAELAAGGAAVLAVVSDVFVVGVALGIETAEAIDAAAVLVIGAVA
jgi:hypothetical protein